MGKWLAKYSADIPGSRTAIADIVPILPALSALSVPHLAIPAKTATTPPNLMAPSPEMLAHPQNRGARDTIAHSADIADRVAAEKVAPVVSTPLTQTGEGSPLPMPPTTPPLQPGWRIAYMDHQWKLAGGYDDPDHGTVQACRWDAGAWTVTLTNGQTIPLSRVRSVGAVDHKGRLYGAWEVNTHGYDGEGPVTRGGQR